jgi:UDP-3-O-[3-hydroxymyristoyl] glucosamine N-acyltransferase
MKLYTAQDIATLLNGDMVGSTTQTISSPEQLELAANDQISFIGNKKYEKLWATSKAPMAVVNSDISIEPGENRAFIKVKNADLAMTTVLELFSSPMPVFDEAIHPTAVIHPTATVGEGTRIGAGCYVGAKVVLGKNVTLYANATVQDDCTIGDGTVIWSGAVVRERCHVGAYCTLHPNSTIGADGFGFRPCPERGLVKIPQIGNVIIGNMVEIGANSCVDRGKFSSTIIGDGCKIDNLVQIGHNSVMGKFCIMAGSCGLAGSVTLGNGVIIGGGSCIKDHVTLGDGVTIAAFSGVMGDVEAGKTMLGFPAAEARTTLKQWAVVKKLAAGA